MQCCCIFIHFLGGEVGVMADFTYIRKPNKPEQHQIVPFHYYEQVKKIKIRWFVQLLKQNILLKKIIWSLKRTASVFNISF